MGRGIDGRVIFPRLAKPERFQSDWQRRESDIHLDNAEGRGFNLKHIVPGRDPS
jgi:hypothetical protein